MLIVFPSVIMERFLMVHNKKRGWELPGGRVEAGERPLDAARREWREETGLPLARLEGVAVHARADGSRGYLFLGASHEVSHQQAGQAGHDAGVELRRGGEEAVTAYRWCRALSEVAELAFPGDPYRGLAQVVLERTRVGPWRLPPGESADGFVRRLAWHPAAAPRGDRVAPFQDGPTETTRF